MNKRLSVFLSLVLMLVNDSICQQIEIGFKDETTMVVTVIRHAYNKLFFDGGSYKYADMTYVDFYTDDERDALFQSQLDEANVVIFVKGKRKYITVPKKVNKIQLITYGNQDWNFNIVMRALIDGGYEIEKNERDYGLISTAPKQLKGLNAHYYLYITTQDSLINIKGNVILNVAIHLGFVSQTPSNSPVENSGMRGSPMMDSFTQMDQFAKKLNYRELIYLKD